MLLACARLLKAHVWIHNCPPVLPTMQKVRQQLPDLGKACADNVEGVMHGSMYPCKAKWLVLFARTKDKSARRQWTRLRSVNALLVRGWGRSVGQLAVIVFRT